MKSLLNISLTLALASCGQSNSNQTPNPTATTPTESSNPAQAVCSADGGTTAEYILIFTSDWSPTTHPTNNFPASPHFSPLVGALHGENYSMWQEGTLASAGIKTMAETGGTSPLEQEITTATSADTADQFLRTQGGTPSPGNLELTFEAKESCALLSITSMIAPSPDWFVGIKDLKLYNNGEWLEEKTIDLLPWDAGTDSGTSYTSANTATNPAESIHRISAPFVTDKRIGTITLKRLQ